MRRTSIAAVCLLGALWALPGAGQAQTFKGAKSDIGGLGGTDYLTAEPGTGRVFVSRGTHVRVVDGPSGKPIGDIPNTPGVHGIALADKWNHGFTTNGGDTRGSMFNLKTPQLTQKNHLPHFGARTGPPALIVDPDHD